MVLADLQMEADFFLQKLSVRSDALTRKWMFLLPRLLRSGPFPPICIGSSPHFDGGRVTVKCPQACLFAKESQVLPCATITTSMAIIDRDFWLLTLLGNSKSIPWSVSANRISERQFSLALTITQGGESCVVVVAIPASSLFVHANHSLRNYIMEAYNLDSR